MVVGLLVLVVAAALRFWRIGWGLDQGAWFPDEWTWAWYGSEIMPVATDALPALPGPLADAVRSMYLPLYGHLGGGVAALGVGSHFLEADAHLRLIFAARVVSAAAGVMTVALTGFIGGAVYDRRVGLGAAVLLAVSPLHTLQSHYASVDVLLAAFFTLTVLLTVRLSRSSTLLAAAAAGGAAGLAFATKYTGLAALGPLGVGIAACSRQWGLRATVRIAAVVGVGFVGATTIACPSWVAQPGLMLEGMVRLRSLMQDAVYLNGQLPPTLGWYGRPWLYHVVAGFPYALGWPVAVLGFVGVGMALARRQAGELVLVAGVLSVFLVVGASSTIYPRFLLLAIPILLVLASRAALGPTKSRARAVLLSAVGIYSLVLTCSQTARFSYDQQNEVAAWIASNVVADQDRPRVAVPATMANFYALEEPLTRAGSTFVPVPDGSWLASHPDVFVLPEWYRIAVRRDRRSSGALRDLERLESGAAGYRRARAWRSWYLQKDLYTWLDPAFAAALWQGEIGFTVYVRAEDPE